MLYAEEHESMRGISALGVDLSSGDGCAEALKASYDQVLADVNAKVPYEVAVAKYTTPFKNVRDALTAIKGMRLTAASDAAAKSYNEFACSMYSKHGSILSGIRIEALSYKTSSSIASSGGTTTQIPASGGTRETEYFFDMGDSAPPSQTLSQGVQNLFSKITGSFVGPPVPPDFQYVQPPPSPSTPPRELLPEERPEYAAAIAAGLDPQTAADAAQTKTFAKNVAASGNPAGALTTPTAGSKSMPWLNPQNIMGVVGTLFSGWSEYQKASLAAQLTAAQNKGQRIQLPPPVERTVTKAAFPWVPVGLGVAGLLAFGVIAYLMMRKD